MQSEVGAIAPPRDVLGRVGVATVDDVVNEALHCVLALGSEAGGLVVSHAVRQALGAALRWRRDRRYSNRGGRSERKMITRITRVKLCSTAGMLPNQ